MTRPTLPSLVLRSVSLVLLGCGIYLLVRAVRRSLYASDYEYAHPASWLDTPYSQLALMGAFVAVVWMRRRIAISGQGPLIPSRAADDFDIRRRRDSKLFNERLKLGSSALSTAGTSSLVAGFVVPNLSAGGASSHSAYLGVIIASVCYISAQLIIGLWKTEE